MEEGDKVEFVDCWKDCLNNRCIVSTRLTHQAKAKRTTGNTRRISLVFFKSRVGGSCGAGRRCDDGGNCAAQTHEPNNAQSGSEIDNAVLESQQSANSYFVFYWIFYEDNKSTWFTGSALSVLRRIRAFLTGNRTLLTKDLQSMGRILLFSSEEEDYFSKSNR